MATFADYIKHLARVIIGLGCLAGWLINQCPAMLLSPSKDTNSGTKVLSRQRQGAVDLSPKTVAPLNKTTKSEISEMYHKQPLRFEANEGQTDRLVKFLVRGDGYNLF